ncbi:SDR family NAD(P)-dependent oxidoreductase [Micromonospora lupini]|uniref:SDR family NAD(P)-dependent oxidoreductase n=1 Tax=Micromonospora lupini TaxID=285679 RepID=UPI0033D20258
MNDSVLRISLADTHSLRGRVAWVTGASGSIGAEISRALAARGAAVALHGRTESALERVVADIRAAGGVAVAHVGDVRDGGHLQSVVSEVAGELGAVDILVVCAGGAGQPTPTATLTPDRWREVIETDLTSVFLTVQAALPGLIEAQRGRIITVASSAGRRPSRANAAYAAAKAGVVMFTEHLAKEYADVGIRVNCVAPSIVDTATLRTRMSAAQREAVAAQVPLGRIGTPADVAEAVVFLASDASSWITGTTLDITGGMTL